MNIKLLTVFLMSSILLFSSCEKEECEPEAPNTYPIEGLWIGTYKYDPGVSPNQNLQYFSFVIKPGGSLIVESKDGNVDYFARGTWTLNGTTLTCTYTYPTSVNNVPLTQTATATYETSGKLVNGKWNNTSNVNEKGTFTMNRVN